MNVALLVARMGFAGGATQPKRLLWDWPGWGCNSQVLPPGGGMTSDKRSTRCQESSFFLQMRSALDRPQGMPEAGEPQIQI